MLAEQIFGGSDIWRHFKKSQPLASCKCRVLTTCSPVRGGTHPYRRFFIPIFDPIEEGRIQIRRLYLTYEIHDAA